MCTGKDDVIWWRHRIPCEDEGGVWGGGSAGQGLPEMASKLQGSLGERPAMDSPSQPSEGTKPASDPVLDIQPPELWGGDSLSLKPPSLWWVVTAAPGNQSTPYSIHAANCFLLWAWSQWMALITPLNQARNLKSQPQEPGRLEVRLSIILTL